MTFEEKLVKVWEEKRPDIKTGRELERAIGLSNGQISKWRVSNPSQKTMEKIATFFHITVDSLLSGETTPAVSNNSNTADLAKEGVFLYNGKEISDDEMAIIKALMESWDK